MEKKRNGLDGVHDGIVDAFIPFMPPTGSVKKKVGDIYRWLCDEVKDFNGAEYVPLMDDCASDEQSEYLKKLGVEVNADELSEDERNTLQLAARLHRGLFDLCKHTHEHENLYAAKKVVTTAIIACEYVKRLESTNPDLMNQVAHSTYEWPVLFKLGVELPKQPINLGKQHTKILGVKNKAFNNIGSEGKHLRQYAIQIVTVLGMNRDIAQSVGEQHLETFLKQVAKKKGCAVCAPEWFLKCAELPDLNSKTFKTWMDVGKKWS